MTQLHRPEQDVELMPLGELLDQWALHRIFSGAAKAKQETFIEDILDFA